jgi:hypothetical protein
MEARERQGTGQAGRWLLETMRPEQRFGVREDQEEHKMLNLSSFPWGQAPLDVLEVCQLDTRRKEAGKAVGGCAPKSSLGLRLPERSPDSLPRCAWPQIRGKWGRPQQLERGIGQQLDPRQGHDFVEQASPPSGACEVNVILDLTLFESF